MVFFGVAGDPGRSAGGGAATAGDLFPSIPYVLWAEPDWDVAKALAWRAHEARRPGFRAVGVVADGFSASGAAFHRPGRDGRPRNSWLSGCSLQAKNPL